MKNQTPEFSRVLSVARIPPKGIEEGLQAKPAERAALAKRFDLIDLPRLEASLILQPESNDAIHVTGTISADVVQQCIVTLEPITNRLDLNVELILVPEEKDAAASQDFSDSMEEEIDTFANGKIDLGELIAQQLGVSIDLYPRKPDAALEVQELNPKNEEICPFAQLSEALKSKKNKEKHKN